MTQQFSFANFIRSWFGVNETVASVAANRKAMLRAIDKEITVQNTKKSELEHQKTKINNDINQVNKTIVQLNKDKIALTTNNK